MNLEKVQYLTRELLVEIGEDPDREGLRDTPKRVARWWQEFIKHDPGNIRTGFRSIETDQMVIVSNMTVYSLCEHHLLPFWCDISVGYIADGGTVLGLSKFARIAHKHAHKLQIQERLVQQIADDISEMANTDSVAVYAKGKHYCMLMRGAKTDGIMHSSIMRGLFKNDANCRAEFLNLIK